MTFGIYVLTEQDDNKLILSVTKSTFFNIMEKDLLIFNAKKKSNNN